MIEQREYQRKGEERLISWATDGKPDEVNSFIAVMSAGKTKMACTAIGHLLTLGFRVWTIVDRVELLNQWGKEFLKFNPEFDKNRFGFIADGKPTRYNLPYQIVQSQTLLYRLSKIADKNRPDIIIVDEAHDVAFHRVITKLHQLWSGIKQINLTATPVRHGNSKVQYSDMFPIKHWYQSATAQQMIALGRWKIPVYHVASDELTLATARRFSGMKISGGDYDTTAQSDVMIDLLADQLTEVLPKLGDKSTLWFVVDTKHALKLYEALKLRGYSTAFISGDEKITCNNVGKYNRTEIVELCREKKIQHLITIQTAVKGFDCPSISEEVWVRRTMSVGIWCQGVGRALRYYEGIPKAHIHDLAGNLALHPFPEEIDWWLFNPCKRLFRDPAMVICRHCNHRHDNIPTPIHPTDKKVTFSVGTGEFTDGLQLPLSHVLVCHSCNAPVFANPGLLGAYGFWLKSVARAVMGKSTPPKFEHHSAGISIGRQDSIEMVPLTIELLYELGVWRFSGEKQERVLNKDRSEEYNKLRDKLTKNFAGRELRDYRFSLLNDKQKKYIIDHPVAEIEKIEDVHKRYRAAIVYAYITDKSPVWAFKYWEDKILPPPKDDVRTALESITSHNGYSWKLVQDWLIEHLEATTNQRHKGICRSFMKVLESLKVEDIAV